MNGRPLVVTFVDQGVDDFWPIDTVSIGKCLISGEL
jgi:hypothetical protein